MSTSNSKRRPGSPSDVLEDDSRSLEEKEQYLEGWRLDLLERVRATEENMLSNSGKTDELSDQLRQVTSALAELRGTGSA
jgi:RNA polymerase-binding transcription factor DksA